MPKPALQLVDKTTGEITSATCPGCFKRDEKIAALQVEKGVWVGRYYNLKREIEGGHGHELFPAAKRLFDYWKFTCRHRYHKAPKGLKCAPCERTQFTAERFKEIETRLREHGEELCRKAIDGGAFDPYTVPRKNGTLRRHNDWEQIFDRGPDKFMEFANKAPVHLPKPEHVHTVAKAFMWQYPQLESHEAVEAAQRSLRRG